MATSCPEGSGDGEDSNLAAHASCLPSTLCLRPRASFKACRIQKLLLPEIANNLAQMNLGLVITETVRHFIHRVSVLKCSDYRLFSKTSVFQITLNIF